MNISNGEYMNEDVGLLFCVILNYKTTKSQEIWTKCPDTEEKNIIFHLLQHVVSPWPYMKSSVFTLLHGVTAFLTIATLRAVTKTLRSL